MVNGNGGPGLYLALVWWLSDELLTLSIHLLQLTCYGPFTGVTVDNTSTHPHGGAS